MFGFWWMPWLLAVIGTLVVSMVVLGIMIIWEEYQRKHNRPVNYRKDSDLYTDSYYGGFTGKPPVGYLRDILEPGVSQGEHGRDREPLIPAADKAASQQPITTKHQALPLCTVHRHSLSQEVKLPSLSPVETLCQDYNKAVQSDSYGEFRKKYKPISTMIGLENALDYMNDRSIDPIFVAKDDGKFLGVTLSNQILVLPKPGMTFLELDHGPGAMSKVFDCGNFSKDRKYTGVQIRKPAVFTKRGSQYHLQGKGALTLGEGTTR